MFGWNEPANLDAWSTEEVESDPLYPAPDRLAALPHHKAHQWSSSLRLAIQRKVLNSSVLPAVRCSRRLKLAVAGRIVTLEVPSGYESLLENPVFSPFTAGELAEANASIHLRVLADDVYPEAIAERFRAGGKHESNYSTGVRANFFDPIARSIDSWGVEPQYPQQVIKGLLVLLLGSMAAAEGGLLLHGAGFVLGELAGAFIGVAGAGKSTAARFVAPDRLLSDDVVIVDDVRSSRIVHATPLGRESDGPGSAPLAALFLPRKRERFSLTRLPPREALAACVGEQMSVLTAVFRPYLQQNFRNLNRLLKIVPCYEMGFSLEGVDREAIREALVGR